MLSVCFFQMQVSIEYEIVPAMSLIITVYLMSKTHIYLHLLWQSILE